MEGRTTHIIALFEMDGARAAVVYGRSSLNTI